MKWINTQELASMLKRFPGQPIEASSYLGPHVSSAHRWEYSPDTDCFIRHIETSSKPYTATELFRLYGGQHWKVKPFFSLRDGHERRLAVRMVEELAVLGHLDDIIGEYGLGNVRVCEHCHHPMDEGWLVDDIRTFCSDECLLHACPDIDISAADSPAYWTKWEE